MARTTVSIREEIQKLQTELKNLEEQESALATLPFNQRLAVVLHESQCHSDHTEHCGWFYEVKKNVHDFTGDSHSRWLQYANSFITRINIATGEKLTPEEILEVAKIQRY